MQKRYVCIWFPHLVTDWFTVKEPSLREKCFVVCAVNRGRMEITAVNKVAGDKGIRIGTALADARAAEPGVIHKDDREGIQQKLLQRMAEWCIRFSPVVAVDLPDGLILDATGCTHLWGDDLQYISDISARFKEKGFDVRINIADTIAAAWALSRFSTIGVAHEGKHVECIRALRPEALRLEPETVLRLHQLGLHTIDALLRMPSSALRRRFGNHIVDRLRKAVGITEEFIQPVLEPKAYEERLPCLDSIQHAQGITIALERLITQLCVQLRKTGKGVRAAELKCYRTDNTTASIDIGTNAATQNETHLLKLFLLKIEQLKPEPGIELFVLHASKTDDCSASQNNIWKTGGDADISPLQQLTDKWMIQFGADNVYRYEPAEHYWTEHSVKRSTHLFPVEPCKWQNERPRPAILLPVPELIQVAAPVPDYPPMHFRHKGKLHKIMKADGPERIEQEWWIQNGEHRDYYIAEDENGCRYWLFRSGHYDAEQTWKWFLHGYFA